MTSCFVRMRMLWLLSALAGATSAADCADAARPWPSRTAAVTTGNLCSQWRSLSSVKAPRIILYPISRKQVANFWSYLPGAAPALLREMQAEMFSTAAALGLVRNGERGNSGNLDLSRNAQSQFNTAAQSFAIPSKAQRTWRVRTTLQVDTRVLDSSGGSSRKQVGPNAGMGAYAQSGNVGSINNQNTVNDQTADATKTGPGTPGVIATPYSQYQRRGATAYQTNTQAQTATTNGITPTYQFGSTSATNTITAVGGTGGGYGGIGALAGGTGAALATLSGAGVPFVTSLGGSVLTSVDPVGQGVKCASQFDGGGCSEEGFLPAAHASARPVEVISEIGTARV